VLESLGYQLRDIDGSHFHYVAPNGQLITIVLGHNEISVGSTKKALRQGGKTWQEFVERY